MDKRLVIRVLLPSLLFAGALWSLHALFRYSARLKPPWSAETGAQMAIMLEGIPGPSPIDAELPRATDGPVVSVADYGVETGKESAIDNVRAIADAIGQCRTQGADRLTFLPSEEYWIQCGDTPAITFQSITDLEIDMQGSVLHFLEGESVPPACLVAIVGCERIRMLDVALEFESKPRATEPGDEAAAPQRPGPIRPMAGVGIHGSRDVTLRSVTVRAVPGPGFLFVGAGDCAVYTCTVDGTSGGILAISPTGGLHVERCMIRGVAGDGIVVQPVESGREEAAGAWAGRRWVPETEGVVKAPDRGRSGAEPGRVNLRGNRLTGIGGRAISLDCRAAALVANRIKESLEAGLYLHSSRPDDGLSPGNVVLRNNAFRRCNVSGRDSATCVIVTTTGDTDVRIDGWGGAVGLSVELNVFDDCRGIAAFISGWARGVFRRNVIRGARASDVPRPFVFDACRNLVIAGNRFVVADDEAGPAPTITATGDDILLEANAGFGTPPPRATVPDVSHGTEAGPGP